MGVCSGKDIRLGQALGVPVPQSSIVLATSLCGRGYSDIHESYTFLKQLGRGSFGVVREALCRQTGVIYAVKSIRKRQMDSSLVAALQRELQILMSAHHPNIVTCYEVLEDSKCIHIVMERCTGGDLFQRVIDGYVQTEEDISSIFQKIFSAVHFLHSHSICHRDLKPENILFSSSDASAEVKIIDFGLSRYSFGLRMNSFVGSPLYIAPEVIKGDYGLLCDVWSLGVLLYLFLYGKAPFKGRSKVQIFEAILDGIVDLRHEELSEEAKDLVRLMLQPREDLRPSLSDVLQHKWFARNRSLAVGTPCLKQFHKRRRSQREIEIEVQ